MKLVTKVNITNELGLHTRPASEIVKMLQNSPCDVFFTYQRETINAKSILSILMLAAKQNSSLTISVEGTDAEVVMDQLVSGFEIGFGCG